MTSLQDRRGQQDDPPSCFIPLLNPSPTSPQERQWLWFQAFSTSLGGRGPARTRAVRTASRRDQYSTLGSLALQKNGWETKRTGVTRKGLLKTRDHQGIIKHTASSLSFHSLHQLLVSSCQRVTFPETNSKRHLKNGWLEYFLVSFWDGIFSGVLVSGSVST